jgi:outer membrane lipoprotein carrier protein
VKRGALPLHNPLPRAGIPGRETQGKSGGGNGVFPRTEQCGNGERRAPIKRETGETGARHRQNDYNIILVLIFLCCLVLALANPPATAVPDVRAEAAAVDEHYNHLHTLQTEFTETYRGSGIERTETGTLWLKKPGKMRWQYRSPKEKLFVSDGKDAWFYVPDDHQARKTPVRQLDDLRSPLALLLGKTKLEKELTGLSLAPDITPLNTGDLMLRGVPKALADRVNDILLEITPGHQIARIAVSEVDGSVTEYRFAEQKENIAISDERFAFTPPAGTETVDGLGP